MLLITILLYLVWIIIARARNACFNAWFLMFNTWSNARIKQNPTKHLKSMEAHSTPRGIVNRNVKTYLKLFCSKVKIMFLSSCHIIKIVGVWNVYVTLLILSFIVLNYVICQLFKSVFWQFLFRTNNQKCQCQPQEL